MFEFKLVVQKKEPLNELQQHIDTNKSNNINIVI